MGLTDCDKCGQPVPYHNDALVLTFKLTGNLSLVTAQSRHLLPVDGCEGSPSRAQYIEGQPRDTRPEYPYNQKIERVIRDVYQQMCAVMS